MKKTLAFLFLVMFVTACVPSPEAIKLSVVGTLAAIPTPTPYPTYTPFPTLTAYPTYTQQPTYTPQPTYTLQPVIVVTSTSSPTPLYTPTETGTPTVTPTLTQTPNMAKTSTAQAYAMLTSDKKAGNYLVGVDIAPGSWRSGGTFDDCYWVRLTREGEIIDNYFGAAGGTIYISPTDFEVRLKPECGIWKFLGPP